MTRVVCGLGNPGPEYEATRHNVGWWVLDEAQQAWQFPQFERRGAAWVSEGRIEGQDVLLLEPLTYMNRSGQVLAPLAEHDAFAVNRDLLVVVDDIALDVGRVRLRSGGSAGGHNGLKSVEAALRTREYARLRVGVGAPPPGSSQVDWVLGRFSEEEEQAIDELLPLLVDAVRVWITDGVDAAASRFNR